MDAISPADPLSQGPLPAYRAMVAEGRLVSDPAQRMAAERLQALWGKLRGYDPPLRQSNGSLLSSGQGTFEIQPVVGHLFQHALLGGDLQYRNRRRAAVGSRGIDP